MDRQVTREAAEAVAVGAAADEQEGGVRYPAEHRGQRADEGVLALAGDQPGDAHDHRPVAQPVPLADGGAVHVRVVGVGVHAGREAVQLGPAVQHPVQPDPEILTEIGRHVDPVADAPQQGTGAGQRGPPGLVAVRLGHRPGDPGPAAQSGGEQPERGRRAEPHGVAAVRPGQLGRPARDGRRGQQHAGVFPDHLERLVGVELRRALPGRGVDDQ